MWKEFTKVLSEIINLRDTTDVHGTIKSIEKNIEIKGYNVWILGCGAMLASIGLDTNSAAVIIGAMLISPLMSPILGIGMMVAINDRSNLMLALENFAIAVIASLLVSTLYFLVTPLGEVTEEMLSRTYPTLLDVLVAIFGGIAGIVAGSRKDKTNAIPGVAIATALMPPLCTAGYGIAKMQWEIFGGAFYLFFINSVFIALSTYLIARFLRFPYAQYVDETARRKAVTWIAVFALLVILPSGFFLYNVIIKVRTEGNIQDFIAQEVNNANHEAVKYTWREGDSTSTLTLVMAGPPVSEDSITYLEERLPEYQLMNWDLRFVQGAIIREEDISSRTMYEVMTTLQPTHDDFNSRIDSLQKQLNSMREDTLQWTQLYSEIEVLFPEMTAFTWAESATSAPFKQTQADTLPMAVIEWGARTPRSVRRTKTKTLNQWLQQRLKIDSIRLVSVN